MWALHCWMQTNAGASPLTVRRPALLCPGLQLRRRAGIPTTPADDETYAAFTNAVAEHEAQLRVQYAGGVRRLGVWMAGAAWVGWVAVARLALLESLAPARALLLFHMPIPLVRPCRARRV